MYYDVNYRIDLNLEETDKLVEAQHIITELVEEFGFATREISPEDLQTTLRVLATLSSGHTHFVRRPGLTYTL